MEKVRSRLSYANVMSTLAVFLALTGGTAAIAISGKNQVKKDDIAKGAVRSDDIAKNAVGTSDVAVDSLGAGDLAPDSVGTSEIAASAVGTTEHGGVPAARIERDADLTVNDAFSETVPFDTETSDKGEFYDPYDMWKPADPEAVTLPVAGLYLVTARVRWAFDDTETPGGLGDQGRRTLQVGAATTSVAAVRMAGQSTIHETTTVINAPAGSSLDAIVFQSNEDASAVAASDVTFEVVWLGPRP